MITNEQLERIAGMSCYAQEVREMARGWLAARKELEGLRQILYKAVRELAYVQEVENCHSGLCATAAGNEIIALGMAQLGVKDLSAESLNPPQEGANNKCPNCRDSEAGCREFGCWKYTPEQEAKLREDADASN
jgi:hypothetical protein